MTSTDPTIGKLGKHPVKTDSRTLNIDNYLKREHLTEIPPVYNWIEKKRSRWGRMKNMHLRNCTCAAAGHMIQCWTLNTGNQVIIPDRHIVKVYSALTGYDPKTGANDNGVPALDMLKYWRKNGVYEYKIAAFASVNHHSKRVVKETVFLFGGVYVGLQLPLSIKGQKVWDVPPGGPVDDGRRGSYGGHAVCVLEYDERGLTCITWGKKRKMTWAFWDAYVEEAYALVSDSFLKDGKTPHGFDLELLEKDLLNITRQKVRLSEQLNESDPQTDLPGNGGKKS